jgi:hypothetical protein
MSTSPTEKTDRPSEAKAIRTLTIAVVLVWFCSLLGLLSVLYPVIGAGFLLHFVRRRRLVSVVILIVTLPVSVWFLWGSIDYLMGNARLKSSGLPGTKFHNLDPELRCGRSTGGCIVMGNEWVSQTPYNFAVRLLTRSFGWMPNTYTGPYPSEKEAGEALANGSTLQAEHLRDDRVVIDGLVLQLDKGVGTQLIDHLDRSDPLLDEPLPGMIATVWQQECVIVRIPARKSSDGAAVVMISRSAGRPFAYYADGSYWHNFPPVAWK